jgi:hypothetical protein
MQQKLYQRSTLDGNCDYIKVVQIYSVGRKIWKSEVFPQTAVKICYEGSQSKTPRTTKSCERNLHWPQSL